MSGSNCCFLTCIQVSQEAGKVVWYSRIFQNFPQFVVTYTVKGFGKINKTEIDVFFWNSLAFSMTQWMLAIWSLVYLTFLNRAWTSGSSWFTYCWSVAWRILSITLLACEMIGIVQQFEHSLKEMGIPDHITCLLRNLYAGQEATVRTGHGTADSFQ